MDKYPGVYSISMVTCTSLAVLSLTHELSVSQQNDQTVFVSNTESPLLHVNFNKHCKLSFGTLAQLQYWLWWGIDSKGHEVSSKPGLSKCMALWQYCHLFVLIVQLKFPSQKKMYGRTRIIKASLQFIVINCPSKWNISDKPAPYCTPQEDKNSNLTQA